MKKMFHNPLFCQHHRHKKPGNIYILRWGRWYLKKGAHFENTLKLSLQSQEQAMVLCIVHRKPPRCIVWRAEDAYMTTEEGHVNGLTD